jgi:Tat protein secretion system quality control protein TatD with DNase activity
MQKYSSVFYKLLEHLNDHLPLNCEGLESIETAVQVADQSKFWTYTLGIHPCMYSLEQSQP